jgi:hypothetical protein
MNPLQTENHKRHSLFVTNSALDCPPVSRHKNLARWPLTELGGKKQTDQAPQNRRLRSPELCPAAPVALQCRQDMRKGKQQKAGASKLQSKKNQPCSLKEAPSLRRGTLSLIHIVNVFMCS